MQNQAGLWIACIVTSLIYITIDSIQLLLENITKKRQQSFTDGTSGRRKAAHQTNRQVLTKILNVGPQVSDIEKAGFQVKESKIIHKTVASEDHFLWSVSFKQ